ncbi:MAG: hypothetical protein HS100_22435 [Anaerolineales bacterium]|nr:hypothetical protein [Anaerolineales bacterium]
MIKRLKGSIKWSPIFLTTLIFITVTSCDNYEREYPTQGANSNSVDYLIAPDTILSTLSQGDSNVFFPVKATPGTNDDILPDGSFSWTQADYLKIVAALSQHAWGDQLEGWELYSLDFDRNCRNLNVGFDSFKATYYKEITINSEERYITRQIDIFPLAKLVSWRDGADYPHSFLKPWHANDYKNFNFTADQALRIAEENGGTDARLKANNECRILVSINQRNQNKWSVTYYPLVSFQVLINPYNGEFIIFNELH